MSEPRTLSRTHSSTVRADATAAARAIAAARAVNSSLTLVWFAFLMIPPTNVRHDPEPGQVLCITDRHLTAGRPLAEHKGLDRDVRLRRLHMVRAHAHLSSRYLLDAGDEILAHDLQEGQARADHHLALAVSHEP